MTHDYSDLTPRRPKAWPFYIVCDVSSSMWRESSAVDGITPFMTVDDSIPQLIREVQVDEQARDIAWVSVIAFATEVTTVLPLTRVREIKVVQALPKGNYTNYEDALSHLADVVSGDISDLDEQYRLSTPTVFFLTDGRPEINGSNQPQDVWTPPLELLKSGACGVRPTIVALGFNKANGENLELIASSEPPGAACISAPGVPANSILRSILDSIVFSITSSTASGQLVFETPPGMTRLR